MPLVVFGTALPRRLPLLDSCVQQPRSLSQVAARNLRARVQGHRRTHLRRSGRWLSPLKNDIPSGKRLHSHGKPPCSMEKTTINGRFPIVMLVYQRVQ